MKARHGASALNPVIQRSINDVSIKQVARMSKAICGDRHNRNPDVATLIRATLTDLPCRIWDIAGRIGAI